MGSQREKGKLLREASSKRQDGGKKIVLTASAVEMSDFNLNPFIAFSAGFPLPFSKRLLRERLYPPPPLNDDGTVKHAPYGLRKIESLLVDEFGEENVATVYPTMLEMFVGKETRVVGISSMDPLGIGFVSRTYTSLIGIDGKPVTRVEFETLLSNHVFKKYRPKVVLGGSGAWQVVKTGVQQKLGIDSVVMGEAEEDVVNLFRKALNGEELPKQLVCSRPVLEKVPCIKKASLFGVVEVTRGCGRGCQFCSPTLRQRYSFPLEHVLKEVDINARSGTRMITLQTDDIFLYKADSSFTPNGDAVFELVDSVAKVKGVKYIQVAHAALTPVVYDHGLVEKIAPTLVEKSRWTYFNNQRYATFEIGIETGSVRLIEKYMRGKALPYTPEQWPDIVVQALGILNDNQIYPLATLVMGLPTENEEDVTATLELLDRLKNNRVFFVPLLFTSEEDCVLNRENHADLHSLSELHWDVFSTCWRHNVKTWRGNGFQHLIRIGGLFAYLVYYRRLHGPRVLKHILKVSGWGEELQ
ncbi:MAG: B12-binding domain-containing radical SAM protein [Candidatus Brockarchaeota archaeon]|nr:B12-binding domain-containing radical SAM protein [Candidatus Brockarchaeota archaeon]MBO3808399.1 B12-binding domain-containing radical SAM protein [Candidatus Brockarchaeota archaeon]